jgi:signal transduction histidine kinase
MTADSPPRILVVDDRPASLYSTTRVLRAGGFTVLQATTGTDAVAVATSQPIDLIVLDINLPDLSGYEVCRQIRADSLTPRMPVIYLSASFVDDVHKVQGYEAGADGYLTHPVESAVLIATVNAFLRTRAIEIEREAALARERVARADAERANRAKDDFLATLSHELRSPLNAIIGWAEVARLHSAGNAEVQNALSVIVRNARFQAKLVSDLLDVSRVTSGKLEVEKVPVDLVAVIDSAIEGTMAAAAAKDIHIERTMELPDATVCGDAQRLEQIVLNLLGNAVKFSDPGKRVEVRLVRAGEDVEIAVADHGRGISAEFLPRVFDRFWQQDASSRRGYTGLGLGLAIVKHLVESHGGSVRAESEGEGKGATFTVRLPLLMATGMPATQAAAARGEVPSLRGLRILVVDDDVDARRWLTQLLVRAQAEVESAGDVAQAVDALREFAPDVLISDVAMPQQDGFDLVTFLRSNGYGADRLPAVAFTAFASAAHKRRALEVGFQAFLSKPIDPAEVVETVARLAGRRG